MDSLTQIALGATTAAVCVPGPHRRKAMMMGACLGTLPDLDVLIDYGDAVSNFTYHRGFSHSLFVLAPFALCLWALSQRFYAPVQAAPERWLMAIMLALLTHPLLDAHTAYGTQLFWPMESPPVMWATLFIIDPLYTLPMLVALGMAWARPDTLLAFKGLVAALVLSSAYLLWSWLGQAHVLAQVKATEVGRDAQSIFITPGPLNTVLWRIVVLDGDRYFEGYYSFWQPNKPVEFSAYDKGNSLYAQVSDLTAAKRLDWFSQGFYKTERKDGAVVISDLRMGYEGHYVFKHVVARVDEAVSNGSASDVAKEALLVGSAEAQGINTEALSGGVYVISEIESTLLPRGFGPDSLGFIWQKLKGQ